MSLLLHPMTYMPKMQHFACAYTSLECVPLSNHVQSSKLDNHIRPAKLRSKRGIAIWTCCRTDESAAMHCKVAVQKKPTIHTSDTDAHVKAIQGPGAHSHNQINNAVKRGNKSGLKSGIMLWMPPLQRTCQRTLIASDCC
jgi:hypothetical protein